MPKTQRNKVKTVFNTQYYRSVQKEIQRNQKMLFDYMKQVKKTDSFKNTLLVVNNPENGDFTAHANKSESSNNLDWCPESNFIQCSQPNVGETNFKTDDAEYGEHNLIEHYDAEHNLIEDDDGKHNLVEDDDPEHNLIEDDDGEHSEENDLDSKMSFTGSLKIWALKNKITHGALNELLCLLRQSSHSYLPKDSRTLLETLVNVTVTPMGLGQYWYNELKLCIRNQLKNFNLVDTSHLLLSFNIDGLPICNSSKSEFWPILCKIDNISGINPLIIAIYHGESKPNLQQFLTPFVDELSEVLQNGIEVNGYKLLITIRCFICDTPARSFIKGTVNFNHYHGCTKCICIGEYYRDGRHMSYPRIDLPARTDLSFRNRTDPDHHKEDTPLERLPIDLIADFPVADSLHLIDLGITKRCLIGWIQGSYNFRTKLSANDINSISILLKECNNQMPKEMHRAVRTLDSIKFWKGTEFRSFLFYLGPVVLKDFLAPDIYNHFLMLSCAVTICSSEYYLKYLNIADKLLKDCIEKFIEHYGIDSVSSNVHNLCHLIEDVKRFGPLPSFSAYPFENYLGQIKSYLRHGNKPLAQIAKRLSEMSKLQFLPKINNLKFPYVKNKKNVYLKNGFMLSPKNCDKWFLTNKNEIFQMIDVQCIDGKIFITGSEITQKFDFFKSPFNSSYINIYCTFSNKIYQPLKNISVDEINCKLISLKYRNEFVFLPLIHTV